MVVKRSFICCCGSVQPVHTTLVCYLLDNVHYTSKGRAVHLLYAITYEKQARILITTFDAVVVQTGGTLPQRCTQATWAEPVLLPAHANKQYNCQTSLNIDDA